MGNRYPHMRPRKVEQRTAEPQNIQPQNFEGRNRCTLSFKSIKIDRIPSFDIQHSLFDTCPPSEDSLFYPRKAKVSFSIKLAASRASGWADNYPQAIHDPLPITHNLIFINKNLQVSQDTWRRYVIDDISLPTLG